MIKELILEWRPILTRDRSGDGGWNVEPSSWRLWGMSRLPSGWNLDEATGYTVKKESETNWCVIYRKVPRWDEEAYPTLLNVFETEAEAKQFAETSYTLERGL